MATYNKANFAETTLGAAIANDSATAITVTSGTPFPAVPFLVTIGTEILKCTSKGTGENWTVTRGEQSSVAAAHDNGAKVENNITAGDFEDLAAAGEPDIGTNGTRGTVQFASWSEAVAGTDNTLAINALELGLWYQELAGKADAFVSVHQVSHGLSVGDAIYCSGANTYAKAKADDAGTSDVVGVVSAVAAGTDDFTLCVSGKMTTGVPAVAAGSVLFLSDTTAGALTTTEPTAAGHISLPVAIVTENAVSMIVYSWRGMEIAAGGSYLPIGGGTLTGNLIMDNMDVTLVKLLTLHGEIDDGNSSTADTIDWNTGTAHKSTLTDNVTLAFTGEAITCVPNMSDNTTPSGVVSYSAQFNSGTYAGWHAFDGNTSTVWLSGSPLGVPQWIQYQFSSGKTILSWGFVATTFGGDPRSFELQGSNNGADYTTLDSVTGHPANTNYSNTIASPASYTYYRLYITEKNAGSDGPSVADIYLYDKLAVIDPPAPCFLTLKLVQDGTGGRTVTWPATVKGSPIINQAPSTMSNVLFYWDGTNYYTLNGLPWVTAPASSGAAGFVGQMAYDASYFYVCTAANTWERAAIATW